MLDVRTPLAAPPAADHIPYWCHGLEGYLGSCSALPPRSLLSHLGHQRSQFTPLIGTGVSYSLFLLLVPPQPRPVHSRWLAPLCGMGVLCCNDCSPGFFLTHSTLASKLFFLAVQGSGALLSSNLEGALYKSPK